MYSACCFDIYIGIASFKNNISVAIILHLACLITGLVWEKKKYQSRFFFFLDIYVNVLKLSNVFSFCNHNKNGSRSFGFAKEELMA